jgi:hypothetical protein
MKPEPAIKKTKRPCMLQTTVVETRVLILFPSLRDVLGLEPTPGDPATITIANAIKLSGLSKATIDRMIARGRQDAAAA